MDDKELKMMIVKSLVLGSLNSCRELLFGPWLPGILFLLIVSFLWWAS